MAPKSKPDTSQPPERVENLRAHKRVEVRLKIALVLDRETACIAHTINVSEGGMLVGDYSGPTLVRGRLVGVNMRGVVSDTEDGDADHFLMRVVWQRAEMLALRFAGDG